MYPQGSKKLIWKPHILRTTYQQVNGNLRCGAREFGCKRKKTRALPAWTKSETEECCKFLQPAENEEKSAVTDVIPWAVESLIEALDRLRVQVGPHTPGAAVRR